MLDDSNIKGTQSSSYRGETGCIQGDFRSLLGRSGQAGSRVPVASDASVRDLTVWRKDGRHRRDRSRNGGALREETQWISA